MKEGKYNNIFRKNGEIRKSVKDEFIDRIVNDFVFDEEIRRLAGEAMEERMNQGKELFPKLLEECYRLKELAMNASISNGVINDGIMAEMRKLNARIKFLENKLKRV